MWVRIDEITFSPDRCDAVIDNFRDTAVIRHDGDGFRGFRLLVDRVNGRALDVSYWETHGGALAGQTDAAVDPLGAPATAKIRSNVYELSIDAV